MEEISELHRVTGTGYERNEREKLYQPGICQKGMGKIKKTES
jgi:hypothetical protein